MAQNIEPDRRSAVSSFYGGRKASFEPLSDADILRSQTPEANTRRADDASSFFNPPRSSADLLTPNAGYNRTTFFDAGREAPVKGIRDEEEGYDPTAGDPFDVYADFNNAGPRYSTAIGQTGPGPLLGNAFGRQDNAYQALPADNPSFPMPTARSVVSKQETDASTPQVELVTVPALGPEWRRTELKSMTKAGRNEGKVDERMRKFRKWNRDQLGLCGKWGTRKQIVIGGFIVCCVVGILLAFLVPRVPGISFDTASPLTNTSAIPVSFARVPANFTFSANMGVRVDATGNYIPLKFTHLTATVVDLDTSRQIATGNLTHLTVPGRAFTHINVPLNFTYVASNATDPTWLNWYNGCRNRGNYPNGIRPGVDIQVLLNMGIAGLIGSKLATLQITSIDCPVELPLNSV